MVAVSSDTLELTRAICAACHGTGESVAIHPACLYCGAQWMPALFDAWIEAHDRPRWFHRNRYKWLALPCGHEFAMLQYVAPTCADCHGVGTVASFQLSERYRQRLTPPAPRTSYRPSRFPPVAPMHTPLLAETTRTSVRLFDWQRGQNWTH